MWREDAQPGHTHDPNEVTIQIDGADRRLDELIARKEAQEASDRPVFVDETGRRSRRFRTIGMIVALACAVYAMVIVATLLSGNSTAPWLPMPGPKDDAPAGKVDTSPLPADSAQPSASQGSSPGASPTGSGSWSRSPTTARSPSTCGTTC